MILYQTTRLIGIFHPLRRLLDNNISGNYLKNSRYSLILRTDKYGIIKGDATSACRYNTVPETERVGR